MSPAGRDAEEPVLIPLGRRTGPTRTVIFHALGGGLMPYMGLVAYLARKGPVYGFRAYGLCPGERPDTRIPDLVDRYQALVDALPEPPDLLVGWSLGGLLAFEVALRAAEGRVPDTVLIDSSPGPWSELPDSYQVTRDNVLEEAAERLDAEALDRMRRTMDAHIAARLDHRVTGRHAGRVLLVTATGSDDPGMTREWRRVTTDLTVRILDTDHFGLLAGPHLSALTAAVGEFLTAQPPTISVGRKSPNRAAFIDHSDFHQPH